MRSGPPATAGYISGMTALVRDPTEFATGAAVLGTGLGVLNLAFATQWGWVPALAILPALIVRALWRTMPGWSLLAWVLVPTVVGELAAVTESAFLVLTTAVAVAAAGPVRRADVALIVLSLFSPFLVWWLGIDDWNRGVGSWIWCSGLLIGWLFGRVVGQQWKLIDELERTRTQLAETAVAEDRQRIARDLHDLVGHSFSVVLLHLAGARMNLASSPDEARAALRQAEEVGRRGMDELRQALVLMRHGPHSPEPFGPGDLDRLVTRYREAGMRVDLQVEGDLDAVGAAPRLVLHDVLREALTNVAKHARAPEASVRIGADGETVTVRVVSPLGGGAGAGASTGAGLAGLEHRVTALDGTFRARADQDAWLIEARLPHHLVEASA